MKKVLIGEFTFVEPFQNDYEELYFEYNVDDLDLVQNNPCFCIVNSITETKIHSEQTMNEIENQGLSYLIPDDYSGIIIWNNKEKN